MEELKHDVRISKALSWLLRHNAEKEGLAIDSRGYVAIDDVLNHHRLKSLKCTRADLDRVVANNAKQRFNVDGDRICATQGHSIKLVANDNMEELTAATIPSEIYHGTYRNKLPLIYQLGGLSRMGRNHVHFTLTQLRNILGARHSANVLIYLDVDQCLAQGLVFYRAKNDAILCSGNDAGIVPLDCFARVVDARTLDPIDMSAVPT